MGYMNNDGLLYFWTKLKTIFVRKVNGTAPDANGNVTVAVPSASSTTPKMDGTAAVGSENAFARGDHVHPTDTTRAASSHTHGNITNAGALQTTDITIANGDKIVVTDASNSNKIARTSVTFDGTTETKALTPKGTWANIPQAATVAPPANDGAGSAGVSVQFARADHKHPTDTSKATGNGRIFYGTSATAGSTAAKVVTSLDADGLASFSSEDLVVGAAIIVKFDNQNTVGSVTLNVNNTGAKSVKVLRAGVGTDAGKLYTWGKGPYMFIYDGTNWIMQAENTTPYESTPEMNGTASKGDSNDYARGDHVHPIDTSRAPVESPAFTGTPTAPTADAGTNNYQIANTAFVQAAIASAVSGVASFKGAVTAQSTIDGTANIKTGWYWVVQTAGTYYGQDCEAGDFIYVTVSSPVRKPGDSTKWADSNFAIIQTNITPMTNSEIDAIVAS